MSFLINSTPKDDGFRMPAEFEAHSGCWMLWPKRIDVWRDKAQPVQAVFTETAIAIAQSESITVGVAATEFSKARELLPDSINIETIESDDSWVRDTGPTFVINSNGELRGIDWEFNAWGGNRGGLYRSWDQDNQVARKVLEIENKERYKAAMVLEGGSITVDGEGTLITTEECLLNPNRNPNLTKLEIEECLALYLNVKKVIWLEQGVCNDETNGHIDNLCFFIKPGVVGLTWSTEENDPQYKISQSAYKRLKQTTDSQGRKLQIHKIIHPKPLFIHKSEADSIEKIEGTLPRNEGKPLTASYINNYIGNGVIILPLFGQESDDLAKKQFQKLFPNRKIVGIYSREILLGGGNIHCITQQIPKLSN